MKNKEHERRNTECEDRVIELYQCHVNPGLAKLMRFMGLETVEWRAEGAVVEDVEGHQYIDCLGGFGAFNFGHRHPRIVATVREQLERMPLSSKILFSEPQAELAGLLAKIAPGELRYSFFCHSGAEAVEGALKLARLATGRCKIVATFNAFHGKTLGALSASGREVYRKPFEPLLPWFEHVPFGDKEALSRAVNESTAAVLMEPIQGEAGVIIPPDDYLPHARRVCDEVDALLIADEVQTGLGRTGAVFAVNHYGVAPDLMTLAKSLGGGVIPLGAVVGTERVFAPLFENPLLHSTTLGGNPLACAAGCAAIEVLLKENLSRRAAELGRWLLEELKQVAQQYPRMVTEVRGKGLLVGVEFCQPDVAGLVIAGMVRRRVLAAYTLNNPQVIRFEPPLVISEEQLQRVTQAFAEAVAETEKLVGGWMVDS